MMKKGVRVLAVLLTMICISMATEDLYNVTAFEIPDHLLECYNNPSIYKRENRLPMTMTTLIELIRNIEQHPNFTMDLKSFALLLTDRFRVDGIEEYPTLKGEDPQYKVTGYQSNKHFFLRGLIPPSTYQLPKNILTTKEKCSLHFMLSSSTETKQRGDETIACNVVTRKQKLKGNARVLRGVVINVKDTTNDIIFPEVTESVKNASRKVWFKLSALGIKDTGFPQLPFDDDYVIISPEIVHEEVKPTVLSRILEPVLNDTQTSSDTTQTSTSTLLMQSMTTVTTSLEQDMFNDHYLNSSSSRFATLFPIILKDSEFKPEDEIGNRTVHSVPEVIQEKSTYRESACPVENGVVYTRWGSVSAGTVLAGIAAGLAQEDVFTYDRGNVNVTVNNLWAATLAGDLAEALLMQFSKGLGDVRVGLRGGWTDTQYPEWYLIESPSYTEMTDAEIRGGIDGLILGSYVMKWNETTGGTLRLSTLLERYYSTKGVFNPEYQACRRKDLYSTLAPTDTKIMSKQVFNFASTLSFGPNVIDEVLEIMKNSTDNAILNLNRYVSSNIVDSCPVSSTQDPLVDLYVIIDCGWAFNEISPFLAYLREEVMAPSRSQFTVFSGQEFRLLLNPTNILMDSADYKDCIQGLNLKKLMEIDLKIFFRHYLEENKSMSPVKSYATAVLFIPHNSTSLYSLKAARHAVSDFRKTSPDITLLFLTSGSLDTYELLVDSMSDVFNYSNIRKMNVEPIITRLKQVPRRITNPSCVPVLSGVDYKTFKYKQVVDYGGTNYYRLHPRYLFPAGVIRIRVQEDKGMLEVCFSRRSAQPHRTSEATECRTTTGPTSEVSLNISEACLGLKDVLQCPPLYISVQSVDVRPRYKCTKDPDCRSSDDVLYTVSFTGMTCGRAGHFLTCPFTLILDAVLTLSITFYQNRHVYIPTKILICGYQS